MKKEKETLIIRLLEGDFPEYGDIVVKTDGHDIHLDRHLFLMMLKRMSILSSDEYKGVIFHFSKKVDKPEDRHEWTKGVNQKLSKLEYEVFVSGFESELH